MKLAKITAAPKRKPSLRALVNPPAAPVRRVNRAQLDRLAGCWPKVEADRIAAFIQENCEAVHEGK